MNRKQRTQYAFNVKVISRNGCFYHILNAHTQEEAVEKAKKESHDATCYATARLR